MGAEVFAGGVGGTVVHFTGSAWETLANPLTDPVASIWGSALDDLYFGGDLGTLVHWNGTALTQVTTGATGRIKRIWGSSSNDVYILSALEVIHYDGANWTPLPRPSQQPTGPFLDLHGVDANTVFLAVGENWGTLGPGVYQWNNPGWTERATFTPGTSLTGIWAAGVDEIYVGTFANLYLVDALGPMFLDSPSVGNVTAVAGAGAALYFVGTGIAVRR